MPNLRKVSAILLSVLTYEFCLLTLSPAKGWAIDMSSEYFKIKTSNISIIDDQKITKDINIREIKGDNYLTQFSLSGVSIKSGLSYLKGNEPFTFSLDSTKLEFSKEKNNPASKKSLQLVIKNGLNRGYQVYIDQISRLTSDTGKKLHKDSLKFSILGKNVNPDYKNSNNFLEKVLSSQLHNATHQTILNFTLKTPPGSEKLTFQNKISIIALPGY